VIELRRAQLSLAEGLFAEEVGDLWEDWMRHVDQVLTDPELLDVVFTALGNRWPHSRTRGRKGTPADVVLRLPVLKHMRNWSYAVVEREVRSNLVYRQFTRVGAEKVPDAKTLAKLGIALGPEMIEKIHQRVVAIAQEKKIVHGRKMRVDTTVVETDIHHPTDSTLLGDGVRVLTRAMKKITDLVGAKGTKLRDRTRSTRYCLINIGRASRSRVVTGKERLQQNYGQAKRFVKEVRGGVPVHAHDQHFVVVRAVEDADAPALGQLARGAPQEIVLEFGHARVLEAEHLAALWVDARHHVLDRAVLARGVHGLEDQQHGVAVGGVEQLLQFAEVFDVLVQPLMHLLLRRAQRCGAGGPVRQVQSVALAHAELIDVDLHCGSSGGGRRSRLSAGNCRLAGDGTGHAPAPAARRIAPCRVGFATAPNSHRAQLEVCSDRRRMARGPALGRIDPQPSSHG
jgi:hypothetical protein